LPFRLVFATSPVNGNDEKRLKVFRAKGNIEIKRWVMAFGRYAKVKNQKWLKEKITEKARAMLT